LDIQVNKKTFQHKELKKVCIIDKVKVNRDNELFKILQGEIWEFRTLYNKTQYRIFAFWDKTDPQHSLVLTTHGIIKRRIRHLKRKLKKRKKLDLNILN
jgi:hypothetical protein